MNNIKKQRITDLIKILNEASYAYYQLDQEIMSNLEFDQLYDELVALEIETGYIISGSPTQKVGYEVVSELPKVKHKTKMLSLNKTKSITELESFLGDQKGLLSWKLDGLTVVLTYSEGKLQQALTRGNGEIGEDITNNAKVFSNIPLGIDYQETLVVRGEAVILYSDFDKINASLPIEEHYKNPRNLCSGSVRQLNNKITKERNVHFYGFSLIISDTNNTFETRSDQLKFLQTLGFQVVEYVEVTQSTLESVVMLFEKKSAENDFASDGLVLSFDSIDYAQTLGVTAKFPKDAIAFKWQDELAETTLTAIEWSASRTGLINPIALFEPVELEGTTVARASLHNISIIEELELGAGDRIKVYKANMIIPQVASNMTRSGGINIPAHCPVCHGNTEIENQKGIKSLVCHNPTCMAKQIKGLSHYVSRDAMNIDGLSESTLEKLVEAGMIHQISDLYRLEQFKESIIQMDGFGLKSYLNLIGAIDKSRHCELAAFIYALGITNVGLSNAKLLVDFYKGDLQSILNAKAEELVTIERFGEVIAKNIEAFMSNPVNRNQIVELIEQLDLVQYETSPQLSGLILSGKSFVITGSLTLYENRNALKKEIEGLGGKVSDSVSATTNYLINNDLMSPSSKNKKAKSLNIPIIDELAYKQLINQ